MKVLSRFIHMLVALQIKFCSKMLLVLGLAMTLLILLQVFFRFVIYVPFPWSEECARYLMIWMGMLGSVIALEQGRHIGVSYFVDKLPKPLHTLAGIFTQTGIMVFMGVLCWQGIVFAAFNADQASPAMEIPMVIPYGAIPAGAAMMILVMLKGIMDLVLPDNSPTPAPISPGP